MGWSQELTLLRYMEHLLWWAFLLCTMTAMFCCTARCVHMTQMVPLARTHCSGSQLQSSFLHRTSLWMHLLCCVHVCTSDMVTSNPANFRLKDSKTFSLPSVDFTDQKLYRYFFHVPKDSTWAGGWTLGMWGGPSGYSCNILAVFTSV